MSSTKSKNKKLPESIEIFISTNKGRKVIMKVHGLTTQTCENTQKNLVN
jgi:hypothetical protein